MNSSLQAVMTSDEDASLLLPADGYIEADDFTVTNVMENFPDEEEDSSSNSDDSFPMSEEDTAAKDKPTRKKLTIASHIDVIRNGTSTCFYCTICQRYFSHKHTMRNHEYCGSGVKPFKCKLCDKRFVKKCDRNNHLRIHSGEKPFTCVVCNKTFYLKHKLTRHLRSHTGIRGDFKCYSCPRVCLSKEALKKHEVNKHNPKRNVQCKNCKKYFEKTEDRLQHKCTKPVKMLVCEICGKMFNKNWNLMVHRRIHVGQRPFQCSLCLKSFRLRQHLERHSVKHQLDADFECMLCKQTFGRKDNMIRHLKLNHPDRHLGLDINDIVNRSEKTRKSAEGNDVHRKEGHTSCLTILAVDNLPNIRFAKTSSASPSAPAMSAAEGTDEANIPASSVATSVIKTMKSVNSGGVIIFGSSSKVSEVCRQPSDDRESRPVSVLRYSANGSSTLNRNDALPDNPANGRQIVDSHNE